MKYAVQVKFHKDFVKIEGNKITVGIMAKPEKGKANKELIKKIAKYLHIPSSRVNLTAGIKSKNKIVEIEQ